MSYRPAFDSHIKEEHRPIVLLYSWLLAKSSHIFKYGDFYLGKGFDVLHIKVEPTQLIMPTRAQSVVSEVLDFVSRRKPHETQPVLTHGFSVGGYLYGETLVKIHETEKDKYGNIGKRMVGQIFDSPVDLEGLPRGLSAAVTHIKPLQITLKASIEMYLKIFQNITVKYYKRSSAYFHENRLELPSLILYSYSDPVGISESIEPVVKKWRARGIPVFAKAWDDSPHVSHFHYHPIDYINALNMFLVKIGLVDANECKMASKL